MVKSNNLVGKVGFFVIGVSVGGWCTIARIGTSLPIELRIGLVAISVAGVFAWLFSAEIIKPIGGHHKEVKM
jgi:hypothetical protein